MARPIGISTKAGPGVTSITTPPSRTSAPTMPKPIRKSRLRSRCVARRASSFSISLGRGRRSLSIEQQCAKPY